MSKIYTTYRTNMQKLKDFTMPTENVSVQLISNFHTHNYLCGHAGGTVTDYVREAVCHGMKIIGISDHCLPPVDSFDPYFSAYNIDKEYLPQFEEAEMLYGDQIRILRGVEIEYFEGHADYYKRLTDKLDYMVLGQHLFMLDDTVYNSFIDGNDDHAIVGYFDSLCAAVKSGLFAMIAHPDLIFYRRPKITPKMTAAFDKAVKCAWLVVIVVEKCIPALSLTHALAPGVEEAF